MTIQHDIPAHLQGAWRLDGSFVGYDYARQVWIDTSPDANDTRNRRALPGSAANPLPYLTAE